MTENFKNVNFKRKNEKKTSLDFLNIDVARKAQKFHSNFHNYSMTPLTELKNLASTLGVSNIYVKDESYRFGLNAFKVLGGSYAIGNYIAEKLGQDIDNLPYDKITSDEVKKELGDITFITATDGNHGRGVAWTANRLRQKSVVYMPKGSSLERLNNIKAEGADASITDMNYDEAVRFSNDLAEKNGWVMVQDTAWEGYEKIPTWIMQGYTTMAYEVYMQLQEMKEDMPTHIFLQAGVGAFAGAVQGFFASVYGEKRPITTIVEPNKADCIYRTSEKNDGKLHFVTGDMDTIMAGLACGEPCRIGYEVLRDYSDNFVSCPDYVTAKGMRVMGNPVESDKKIISGESGAVTIGLIAEIFENKDLQWLKEELKLDENSRILCFSTEGNTDKESYRDIVWNGKYPSHR
ncbi:MAG: diaminopropionate ammonia-lyase [Clostridium beijerinckii]|jgi:diaminopropionate ammonia-lyase|uniref:Diaminopropionate ammonia-lyase n=1 Tax=Clostridium beijerinckii TaxID=1520 RepID=A0A1S9N5C0_CLOBE|nr:MULTISPECIES: diaminopropionate ammonia-lyase [Clostridium]MBN7573015.1 diaminopropionate ammonia-lyase [Clostridium beijerinckii]MBN7578184.1 diaminopropionate ammonia-lyase [Clostridium beijerinckii]MBN7582789.1 diaminopropionate ammonia-lyase [Clostridium beijerinckii]MBO0521660.1 diaminopropionate ammonia-lyase [Clostridium beijerinckii]MCI1478386.1 diaminopropionate ammonia-lyase [Clostridium beijerinckii]